MKELYFDYVLRTRYAETDQMGVVYYGNYPQYLELGRVEWLRSIGFTYKAMEEEGVMMPVVSLQIQYKKPSPDVKKTSKFLPSTGEQVTFLGIIGVILLGVVIYVLKKSKKK